jgi:hypothetical protein
MRTTLDLPDPLMREIKVRAAQEGIKLKDYFARLVQTALQQPTKTAQAPARSPAPVFQRVAAKPMPALSNAELNRLLDAQDGAKVGSDVGNP